jgi:hypothetical protein
MIEGAYVPPSDKPKAENKKMPLGNDRASRATQMPVNAESQLDHRKTFLDP